MNGFQWSLVELDGRIHWLSDMGYGNIIYKWNSNHIEKIE